MESSEDKQWASRYLLDPLNAPEPSDETGPGTHYNSTFAANPTASSSSFPFKKPSPSVSVRSTAAPPPDRKTPPSVSVRSSKNPYRNGSNGYPSPPASANASPRTERFPNSDQSRSPQRRSLDRASSQIPTSTGGQSSSTVSQGHRRRGSSLNERHQGDQTHRPLDMLRQDEKKAYRAPHLRKKNHVGADSIDTLDNVAGAYHHEGPYDATLLARNTSYKNSPVEAVNMSNEEALKATPREKIQDAVEKHRPLDGVAIVPPGMIDRYGRTYNYQEGTDMMIEGSPEGGAYKRWPGVKYLPEDLKGKGEPSYSLEKALKEHKSYQRNKYATAPDENNIEMTAPAEHRRPSSVGSRTTRPTSDGQRYAELDAGLVRNSSGAGKLRKRFGSLRVNKD